MNPLGARESSSPPREAFRELLGLEFRLAVREPTGIIFGVGLPILLLVIFGSVPVFHQAAPGTSLTLFQVYLPILVVTVLIMISLVGLPVPVARDREIGWLRRLSTTPVGPARLLAAQVVIHLLLALAAIVVLVLGGRFVFGVPFPPQPGSFLLGVVLGTGAMLSLSVLVAAVSPTEKSAGGLAMGLLYPLLFFAGVYVPVGFLPNSLQIASQLTPVGPAVEIMTDGLEGSLPPWQPIVVLVAYTVVLAYLAVRLFRWE